MLEDIIEHGGRQLIKGVVTRLMLFCKNDLNEIICWVCSH